MDSILFLALGIFFLVGLIARFTDKKKGELFQIGLFFTLLAFIGLSDRMPSTGTGFDVVFYVGTFFVSFYLGALISSIILFIKRKRGEKPEAEDF